MATGDEEAQEDELLALASIYNEDVFEVTREDGRPGGQFSARLQLPDHFSVQSDTSDTLSKSGATSHEVKYLLPIMLFFQLPPDYPSCCAPTFTISCKWLTLQQLSQLCNRLDKIWDENKGDVILFLWTSFLKDDALGFLQITSPLDLSHVVASMKLKRAIIQWQITGTSAIAKTTDGSDSETASKSDSHCVKHKLSLMSCEQLTFDPRAVQDISSQQMLLPAILEYDREQRLCVFHLTVYACQVCFVEKLGDECLQFDGCGHVYCKNCMKAYFKVQIQDGSVQCLTCPYERCESQAHPAQVKELMSSELFARYDRLLLQASLESMPDVLYCSRKSCGCAVMVDTGSSMARCPSCHYVFCIFCKQVYHGISPCRIKEEEARKLRELYTNASPQERKILERRYGLPAIHHVMEETETMEWLEEHSKKCPHCGTHIQKIDGCNKMTCTKCRCYFCWMCGEVLSHRSPYSHFSNPSSPCFNRLFHGVILNDDDDDDDDWLPID